MDNLLIILLLFFIELAETAQYNGKTFNDVINGMYAIYKNNIFHFMLFNSSLLYVLYISFEHAFFNIWSLSIVLMKLSDLAIKIYLFKKIDKEGYFNIEGYGVSDIAIDWKIKYFSVILYTALFIPAVI